MNAQLNEAADRGLRTSGRSLQTEVCIIGAGAMGLCTATLLAQAGVQCVVVERNEIGSGATSNNAGVLHSGARYAVADPSMAGQCLRASDRLARFARHAITNANPAYYLIIDDATEEYAARFLHSCSHLGIPCEVVDRAKVCHEEPILDETRIRGAISVPDRVFDPFALLASYEQFLQDAGTRIYPKTQVSNAVYEGSSWKMGLVSTESGAGCFVESRIVLVTAGAWSPCTLKQFGVFLIAKYIKGSMFVIKPAVTNRILCLCNLPVSGDSLVPCGSATLLGSTWEDQESPEPTAPSPQELQGVTQPFSRILRCDLAAQIMRAYSGVRVVLAQPNKSTPEGWDRVPQGTFFFDHQSEHGAPGLLSAFGGKLATHLETATAMADLVIDKLGRSRTLSSRLTVLPSANRKLNRDLGNPGDGPYQWRIDT